MTAADREKLSDLLPLLDTLSREHPDDSVLEMATDLRIAIATQGHVLSDALKMASQNRKQNVEARDTPRDVKVTSQCQEEKSQSKKPLIEVISSQDAESSLGSVTDSATLRDKTKHGQTEDTGTSGSGDGGNSDLDTALQELMDPDSECCLQ